MYKHVCVCLQTCDYCYVYIFSVAQLCIRLHVEYSLSLNHITFVKPSGDVISEGNQKDILQIHAI